MARQLWHRHHDCPRLIMTPVTPLHPSSKRFYLSKGRVQPILLALVELQQRTDLSGKFARKLSRIRRVLAPVDEGIVVEVQVIEGRFTRRMQRVRSLPVFQKNAPARSSSKRTARAETPMSLWSWRTSSTSRIAPPTTRRCSSCTPSASLSTARASRQSEFDAFKAVRGRRHRCADGPRRGF
jgi:hypothetical protein